MDDFNFNFDDDDEGMLFPGLGTDEEPDESTDMSFLNSMGTGNQMVTDGSLLFDMEPEQNSVANSVTDPPNSVTGSQNSETNFAVQKETAPVSKLEKMLAGLDFKKAGFLVGGCVLVFSLLLAGINKMLDRPKAPTNSTYVEEQVPVQQQQPVQQQPVQQNRVSDLLLTSIDESSLNKYNPQSYELDVSLKKKQLTLVQNTLYYTFIFDIMGTDIYYYVSENSYRKVDTGDTLHLKYTTYTTNSGYYYQISSVSTP